MQCQFEVQVGDTAMSIQRGFPLTLYTSTYLYRLCLEAIASHKASLLNYITGTAQGWQD